VFLPFVAGGAPPVGGALKILHSAIKNLKTSLSRVLLCPYWRVHLIFAKTSLIKKLT